ncbi:unnamed protein product [Psylliodes chrysocephalus]|uniref:Uncharacterized protein n=1 Tax=Psylliodes chrysocephalus TaxID=3402493 RepID=A0A9P0D1B2_9CUCU|nr:unnamed protein product [Psylliodes chrysocephala]
MKRPLSENELYELIEVGLSDVEELCDEETDDILTFEALQNENGITDLHAMTRCDYIPALYRKGNKKLLQIVLQSVEFQDAFINSVKKIFPCFYDLCAETASSDEETNEDEEDDAISDGILETDVDAFD